MSIAKLQELFQKSGCGLAVLIVCAAVMVGGVFYSQCAYSNAGSGGDSASSSRAIMHVAGVPVSADEFNREMEGSMAQAAGSPDVQSMIIAQMLRQREDQGAQVAAVQQAGIKTDDATLLAAANAKFDTELDGVRQGMIANKKLPANATPAQFAAAVKAQYGKTPDELRAAASKRIADDLKDPEARKKVIAEFARDLLLTAARARHNVTDAEVRASYQTFNFQQLRFFAAPNAKTPVDAQIKAAQAEIQKGVPFAQVVDKYSGLPGAAGKKPSENLVHYSSRELSTQPDLKPLAAMKVGQISPVIDSAGGKSIYKLVSITSALPKDYEKSPEKYRKEYIDQLANQEVQDEIAKAKATPGLVKYDSPAYQALADANEAGAGMMSMNAAPQPAKLQQAYDEALKASNGADARIAALARYEAETKMWNTAPDKAKMRDQRIATLLATLSYFEDFDLRMELVDDYLAEGKKTEAAFILLTAAQNNTKYDETGITHFTSVRDKLQQMIKDKTIDPRAAQQIEDAQLSWSRARADYDAQQAEMKREQAAEKARQKIEDDRAMAQARAEAAKHAKEEAAKHPPTAKAPAGSAASVKPGAITAPSTGGPAKAGAATTGTTPPPTAGTGGRRP